MTSPVLPGAPSRLLQLLGLSSFAWLWPILDLWQLFPEFLVVHGVTRRDVVLAILLCLLPALLLFALEELLRRSWPKLAAIFHVVCVGVLLLLIVAAPLGRLAALANPLPSLLAVALASLGVLAWLRFAAARTLTSFAAAALPVFVATFLAASPVREALRPAVATVPASARPINPVPVVLIVFDELPLASLLADSLQIDRQLYPNFARLADCSSWYPEATSVAHSTLTGVSAILSGLYPEKDMHATLASRPRNLFTLLWDVYPRHVMEPATQLEPRLRDKAGVFHIAAADLGLLVRDSLIAYAHTILPTTWRAQLPPVDRNWIGFEDLPEGQSSPEAPGRRKEIGFEQWIEGLSAGDSLLFAHTVLPHAPFRLYPSGRRYSRWGLEPSGAAGWGRWKGDEWAILHSQQRHLLQLGHADQLLGRVLNRLEELGLFEDALLLVTADHGLAFDPKSNRRSLENGNAAEILCVPLFVKLPRQAQAALHRVPAETIDILPTVLDVLDMPCDWVLPGHSLLSLQVADRPVRRALGNTMREFPSTLPEELAGIARRNRARFPLDGPGRLYGLGPHAGLFGRAVTELRGEASQRRITLRQGALDLQVSATAEELPGELVGTVSLQADEEVVALALAVDGIVRALTRNYGPAAGPAREVWSAILPESALTPGAHRLEIFEIAAAADAAVRLLPLPIARH